MKTRIAVSLAAAALAVLAACARENPAPPPPVPPDAPGIDLDLASMSSTMVYSQLFAMFAEPENHVGKTVRLRGTYATAKPPGTTNRYHACFVSDAAACCAQGIEFVTAAPLVWPGDYPAPGDPILVQGVFSLDENDGMPVAVLRDAVLSPAR